MKIAHTADWHLGKRTESKSRLSEQSDAINEFVELCDRQKADIAIIAGDIFDTAVPSADAEEVFYRGVVALAKHRPVVVLAGNHDDADRLKAPFAVAKTSGIYLVGGLDNECLKSDVADAGFGWLRFYLNGEKLNLATLPFPSRSRMDKFVEEQFKDYPQFVSNLVSKCTMCFGDGINVFASHLFMDGCLMGDEYAGNSIALTKDVLPDSHYCALGHIHKPQCVSRSKNAYYSGSLLKYHFDETDDKEFVIFDSASGEVEHYRIKSGKKLVRLHATDFTSAVDLLSSAGDVYAELIYESELPLMPSQANEINSFDCLAKLTIINKSIKREVLKRREQTDAEIFGEYYKAVRGNPPDADTLKAFLEVIE